MNRTDRLFGIVLDLQARGRQRAEDLAGRYETSVRTIYRDVIALCEAGVPIVSLPGQGYALPEDYFLPPLSLTIEEATALSLGADYVAQTLDASYADAAKSATTKIAVILPQPIRRSLERTRSAMKLVGAPPADDDELEALRSLRTAILEERVVEFVYHGVRSRNDPAHPGELRRVAPYGLARLGPRWYVVAHSYEREALRLFRLSRMERVELTPDRFVRPPDFVIQPFSDDEPRAVTVRFTFDASVLRWMRERLSGFEAEIEDRDGSYLATLRVHHEEQILSWALSWGSKIRIVGPPSLCERIAAEARAVAAHHSMLT